MDKVTSDSLIRVETMKHDESSGDRAEYVYIRIKYVQ